MQAPISNFIYRDGALVEKINRWPLFIKIAIVCCILLAIITPKQLGDAFSRYTPVQQIQAEKESELQKKLASYDHVSNDDARKIVESVYKWASEFNIKPSLILAVIATESTFNKYAISNVGAFGLMQVLPRWHVEKFVKAREVLGTPEPFDIDANIYLGTWILKDCMTRYQAVDKALKCYNGSLGKETDYHLKVMQFKKKYDQYI